MANESGLSVKCKMIFYYGFSLHFLDCWVEHVAMIIKSTGFFCEMLHFSIFLFFSLFTLEFFLIGY